MPGYFHYATRKERPVIYLFIYLTKQTRLSALPSCQSKITLLALPKPLFCGILIFNITKNRYAKLVNVVTLRLLVHSNIHYL